MIHLPVKIENSPLIYGLCYKGQAEDSGDKYELGRFFAYDLAAGVWVQPSKHGHRISD